MGVASFRNLPSKLIRMSAMSGRGHHPVSRARGERVERLITIPLENELNGIARRHR